MTAEYGAARPAEAGFTLLELLIALVVFSLLMTLLVNGLQLTGKSWQTVQAHTTHRVDLRTTRQALRRQLQQVIPYAKPGHRSGVSRILFDGDRREMTFVGRLPDHVGGTLQRMRLSRSDQTLELRLGPINATGDGQEAWSETISLLDGVDAVTFSYFDDRANEAGQWVDHWRDQIALPRAIRVDVDFSEGIRDDWLPLIVRPMITCYTSC